MGLCPYVMIWAAIPEDHMVGPYFFNTSVYHTAYLNMLYISGFLPHLNERRLEAIAILQQDGAPAHYALPVSEYLDDKFSGMNWSLI
jgi:hypothetical protein